jgi:hypothetical protein
MNQYIVFCLKSTFNDGSKDREKATRQQEKAIGTKANARAGQFAGKMFWVGLAG